MKIRRLDGIVIFMTILMFGIEMPDINAQEISRSFEMRYYTNDAKANGESDFSGEKEVYDTEKRIEYLNNYEKVAGEFFDNKNWDKLVLSDDEAKAMAEKIKKQPLPEVRKRLMLDNWKMIGSKSGKREAEQKQLEWWNSQSGVEVKYGQLHFTQKATVSKEIEAQDWRSLMEIDIVPAGNNEIKYGDAVKINLNNGKVIAAGTEVATYENGKTVHVKVETDLENGKYNLYINEQKVVDFLPVKKNVSYSTITISGSKETIVDNIYGVKYHKKVFTEDLHTRDVPFHISTSINEDFSLTPSISGWQTEEYNDSEWKTVNIPYPHGGDRNKEESMYLRKTVTVGDFTVANLNIETICPRGEVWVNGEVVAVTNKEQPFKLDISRFLKKNSENTIAIRVLPHKVEVTNRHTAADLYTGWYTGRAWIDFHQLQYIKDVFVYTKELSDDATVALKVNMQNDNWEFKQREIKEIREFNGILNVKFYKWFPEESVEPAFEEEFPVYLRLNRDVAFSKDISIKSPDKWHFNDPNLYKVVVTLIDTSGKAVDDYVITTGIRTVSQEGGTFRINGNSEMMNGALVFGYKYPLEDIARTMYCGEEFWLVKEIMMIKRLNGNTIRMSHHDEVVGGINDPRFAEIGDQLGVMLQWATSAWVRSGSPWLVDFDVLSKDVKQVRNHPSIVMWQPGNHPKFLSFEEEGTEWFKKVYNSIYPYDPSRLISPTASNSKLYPPNDDGTIIDDKEQRPFKADPVWTAPMITRGNMDHATGYSAKWSDLRIYPYPEEFDGEQGWRERGFRTDYLNSKERAYFDFESEESISQPNWALRKGKPSYEIQSYEHGSNISNVGRILKVNEWRISQSYQGFSAFEAYKKKRFLDYDGQAWCTLHGGGNTSTYQKPLIDYFGYSKMAFHTVKMAFQPVLACSKNVDVMYGPDDKIPVVVMNLGVEKTVDVVVTCKNLSGEKVFEKKYNKVSLKEGRTFTNLEDIELLLKEEGYYVFEYKVME